MKSAIVIVAMVLSFFGSINAKAGLTNTASACLDENIGGKQLEDQFNQYKEARDKVEAFQQGDQELSKEQVIDFVTEEVQTAVRSWVRAACALYLGDLKKQAGDLKGAKEAYKACAYYSKLALKFDSGSDEKNQESQMEGAKYALLSKKKLHHLK